MDLGLIGVVIVLSKILKGYLFEHETEVVLDVDISNFFGNIDHKRLLDILQSKISDQKFIRYIARMFKAGILADEELIVSDEGVFQGSICSSVLANMYAHYLIDLWYEEEIMPRYEVKMFRYSDDIVIVCLHEEEAGKVKAALEQRLNTYGLSLNKEKTKLVPFSKLAARGGIKQGSFNFLGFTFYFGRSLKGSVILTLRARESEAKESSLR
jgi:retron-type reverse transcriptase